MLYTTTLTGPLGPMMLAGTETHLTGLWLEGPAALCGPSAAGCSPAG